MVIYIDVLVIINLYVTFFLFKAAGLFFHERFAAKKLVLACFIGAASSLFILLESEFLSWIAKLILLPMLVVCGFGFGDLPRFLKRAAVFFLMNIFFAGVMFALWLFVSPARMLWQGGVVYFDISPIIIAAATILSYLAIKLVRRFAGLKLSDDTDYNVTIHRNGKTAVLSGLADTGNAARDAFSGLPLIISDTKALADLFDVENPLTNSGARLTPFSTVNGSGLMTVLSADSIFINGKNVRALIGLSNTNIADNNNTAIFNPKLLI